MIKKTVKKLAKKIAKPVFNISYSLLMSRPALRLLGLGRYMGKQRALFDAEELKLVHQAILSQNLFSIDGEMIPAFEREFASAYDVPYAVASTSGTAAIHTALGALDLNPGDEVITAPITDLGTIVPILYQNAIPVFADINETYNMDPADVERKITSRTRAIIVVHLFGNPCDMDAMVEIAKRHNIPLIEDCAQAHVTEYKRRYVGTFGDIGCFSFQQSKHMTTGEGGMTITSNSAYYDRMKLFIDKGWARKGWGSRAYRFLAPNYRPTELVGAVGLAQLKKVKEVVRKRHELGEFMNELLSPVEGITPAPVTPGAKHSYWLYPMRVEGMDVNLFAQEMMKEKIWVSAGYTGKPIYLCTESLTAKKTYGLSQCPFSCKDAEKVYEYKEGLCPRSEEALKHLVCIPLDESWSREHVQRTANAVLKCMNKLTAKTASSVPAKVQKATAAPPSLHEKGEKKVRIGIVGCGQMGRWHLDAYRTNPHVELAAFADNDFEKAQKFALEAGAKAYASHAEMIANEKLDGVSICTVPSTHKNIALDFLNAGVNILCEKPLAVTTAEAQEMCRKAEENNLFLLTAFKFRFFEEVLKAKELIEKGSLGKILNFRLMFGGFIDMSETWFAKKEIAGGGVIMDNGPHALDIIHYLLGDIECISAQTTNYQNIDVEDTAHLTCSLKNGAKGNVDLSWSSSVPARAYLEIYGEDGAILLDYGGITYKFKIWDEWKRIPGRINAKEAFARQVDHFVGALVGEAPSIVRNEDGLKSQMAIEAAYESMQCDKKVYINTASAKYGTRSVLTQKI